MLQSLNVATSSSTCSIGIIQTVTKSVFIAHRYYYGHGVREEGRIDRMA
jgi:hypothetical protein